MWNISAGTEPTLTIANIQCLHTTPAYSYQHTTNLIDTDANKDAEGVSFFHDPTSAGKTDKDKTQISSDTF